MTIKRDKYDKAVSDYVRSRDNWTCQRCNKYFPEGSRGGLHCSHYFGRASKSTRYDPENCIALCHGCHGYYADRDREAYRDLMIGKLGQDGFDELTRRARKVRKWVQDERDELLELINYELSDMDKHDPDLFVTKLREAGL